MIDYEKVDKLVENCKQLYPDMPDYVLWVLACDFYIHEAKNEDDEESLRMIKPKRNANKLKKKL